MEPSQKFSTLLQDKWIATITWVALLLALVYTSGEIATISYSMNLYGFSIPEGAGGLNLALVTLVLFGAMVTFMLSAWLKYVALTTELYINFADQRESENVFENLVNLTEVEDGENTENTIYEMAEGTMIGAVVKPLCIAWGLSIISPVILSVATKFLL